MKDGLFTAEGETYGGLLCLAGCVIRSRVCHGVGQERGPVVIVNTNMTAQRYIDDILPPTVLPFLQQQPRGVIYQHDNARSHTARIVQNLLEASKVNVLPCIAGGHTRF